MQFLDDLEVLQKTFRLFWWCNSILCFFKISVKFLNKEKIHAEYCFLEL